MDWKDFYNRVYSVLAENAGAHEHYREFYVADALREERPNTEWRFQGKLGFGGKVHRNNGRIYVTYYREDQTPERETITEKVNALLASLLPPEGVWGPPEAHARIVGLRAS